jgi:hypothetical protein
MATKQAESRAAGLRGDYGTLRETFFEQEKQSIGLQGSMLSIADENRRAIDAMQRKTQSDALIHKSRMAQMGFDFRKKMVAENLADRTVANTFGLMDQILTEQRNANQLDELRKAMGLGQLATPSGILNNNVSGSTYGLPEVGGLA